MSSGKKEESQDMAGASSQEFGVEGDDLVASFFVSLMSLLVTVAAGAAFHRQLLWLVEIIGSVALERDLFAMAREAVAKDGVVSSSPPFALRIPLFSPLFSNNNDTFPLASVLDPPESSSSSNSSSS